jgi:hypothetical protein
VKDTFPHGTSAVIIAPLDWGLGHLSRSAMKVRECLHFGNDVFVAVNEKGEKFYRAIFGDKIKYLHLPGYEVSYSRFGVVWGILRSLPRMWKVYKMEHELAEKWVNEIKPSRLFSDHRYGFWSNHSLSIFMTHQIWLPVPWYLGFLNKIHHHLIEKFTIVSIYDQKVDPRYAGKLSRISLSNRFPVSTYSGLASQFLFPEGWNHHQDSPEEDVPYYDLILLVSGPEPHRTRFENRLIKVFNTAADMKVAMVRGADKKLETEAKFPVYDMPSNAFLLQLLKKCSLVVCRSGYSTLMDLVCLGKVGILVPTPGQWEQEYLAKHWNKQFNIPTAPESKLHHLPIAAKYLIQSIHRNIITGTSK